MLLVAAGLALTSGRRTSLAAPDPIQVSIATPEIADVHLGEVALPVFISPDGRYLAIYGADALGTNHLWIRDLRTGTTKLVAERAFAAAWSPDSRTIAYFSEGKLKTVSLDGGPPRVLCEARPEGTPTWHGDTILFAQYSRDPGIYRVSAGGGTPEQIVRSQAEGEKGRVVAWWPEFLPGGRRFLYALRQPSTAGQDISHQLLAGSLDGTLPRTIGSITSRAVYADGHLLFVRDGTLLGQPFDPDALRFTGDPKPITKDLHYFRNTGLAAFTVSKNGLLAWRAARPESRLVWLDRGGLEIGSLGRVLAHGSGRLSPDGKRYALGIIDPNQGTSDIWVYDLARESQERLTFQLLDENNPVWAPDGTIYYRSDGGGPPDIFKLTPGRERSEIVYRAPGVDEPHDVSPNGRELLFIDYTPPVGADIKVLPLAPGGTPRPLAATPFQELSPRYSPDGKMVAYSADISGRPEVYVRPSDGTTSPRPISRVGGTRPRWSRNGNELFFLAPGGRLMVAPVRADVGVPRMLFQAADAMDFEVSTDGTRFLVQLIERSREPTIHVLINWRARLQGER